MSKRLGIIFSIRVACASQDSQSLLQISAPLCSSSQVERDVTAGNRRAQDMSGSNIKVNLQLRKEWESAPSLGFLILKSAISNPCHIYSFKIVFSYIDYLKYHS